jgi:hypothetical protein
MKLKISPDLSLPEEAFYQPWGILAMRGAGKTNAAAVMAEELFKAGRAFVVVDPVGSWWGLRAGRNGKPEGGLPIPVLGGDHADVPLEEAGGEAIADFLVDERVSSVVDVSALGENSKHRFLADFASRLFRRNQEPLVVFLEEADDYAPQRVGRGPALATLGAMQRLVKRGRFKGLTPVLVTQRSAAINKDLLTQIENLVVLRTTSPQDRKAIEAWVTYHAQSPELLESLASLVDGEAWLWSPQALKKLERFRFRLRETFDSGATPKSGGRRAASLADVDLGELRKRMAGTIARAEAVDPKILQREIAALKKQLAQRPAEEQEVVREVTVEVPVLTEDDRLQMKKLLESGAFLRDELLAFEAKLNAAMLLQLDVPTKAAKPPKAPEPIVTRPPIRMAAKSHPEYDGEVSAYGMVLLEAMARRHPTKLTRGQISTLSGRSRRSSAFDTAMGEIVRTGMVQKVGDLYELTPAGRGLVGAVEGAAQTPEEVQRMWLDALPDYEAALLRVLLAADGAPLSREQVAHRAGRSITSSAFDSAISTLVKNGLADKGPGWVSASVDLFMS